MREVAEVSQAVLGEFNPSTAGMMGNLGLTYKNLGKLAEAEEMFNNSMKVLVAIQGPEDNGVAKIHSHLASFNMVNKKDFRKAEEHHLQCLKIREKLHGPA